MGFAALGREMETGHMVAVASKQEVTCASSPAWEVT